MILEQLYISTHKDKKKKKHFNPIIVLYMKLPKK